MKKQIVWDKNRAVHVGGFQHGDDSYSLWLFVSDGDYVGVYKNHDPLPVFEFDSSSWMRHVVDGKLGETIGWFSFHTNQYHIKFTFADTNEEVNTQWRDFFKAEEVIAKMVLTLADRQSEYHLPYDCSRCYGDGCVKRESCQRYIDRDLIGMRTPFFAPDVGADQQCLYFIQAT